MKVTIGIYLAESNNILIIIDVVLSDLVRAICAQSEEDLKAAIARNGDSLGDSCTALGLSAD